MAPKVYIAGRDEIPRKVSLGAGEELDILFVVFPGADCSIEMDVDLCGTGADAQIRELYLATGNQKVVLYSGIPKVVDALRKSDMAMSYYVTLTAVSLPEGSIQRQQWMTYTPPNQNIFK